MSIEQWWPKLKPSTREWLIDNNGDALEDITYRFDFFSSVGNHDVPLYNTGPIEPLDDPLDAT